MIVQGISNFTDRAIGIFRFTAKTEVFLDAKANPIFKCGPVIWSIQMTMYGHYCAVMESPNITRVLEALNPNIIKSEWCITWNIAIWTTLTSFGMDESFKKKQSVIRVLHKIWWLTGDKLLKYGILLSRVNSD